MPSNSFRIFGVLCLGGSSFSANAQEDATLKARELFYEPPAVAAPARQAVKHPVTRARKHAADPSPEAAAPRRQETANQPGDGDGAAIVKATYSRTPLALKYSLLKKTGSGYVEVDPDAEFKSGDHIRVRVQANDTAYLYIVMHGSSGTWQVLFPSPETANGDNRVEKGHEVTIPAKPQASFYFDENAGTEKVSLILSRQPEPDLEKLIYAVGSHTGPAIDSAPGKTVLAQSSFIDDAFMGRVQEKMLPRDLVFEKVDEKAADGKEEKAIYAATPDKSAGARLFVDLKLKHN